MNTPKSDITIFDRHLIKQQRQRAAKNFVDHGFLFEWSKNQLHDRLLDVNRNFENTLHIGSRCPLHQHPKIIYAQIMDITDSPVEAVDAPYIQGSEDFLPIKSSSLDLITSNLNLHSVNDLPGALVQIKHALKKDGLFLASMFGGETLHELRTIMTEVEIDLYGGTSPHVFPFADKPQMGDLLHRAGFALPVIDSDFVTVTYEHVFKLFADLRGMGESNSIAARNKKPLSRTFFMECAKRYHEKFAEADNRITATFEVIFLLGWAPHESQQKPLKPGSAEYRLADVLKTEEIKT